MVIDTSAPVALLFGEHRERCQQRYQSSMAGTIVLPALKNLTGTNRELFARLARE